MLPFLVEFCSGNIFLSCSLALACLIGISHVVPRLKNFGYNLPPGPLALPVIGYFPFLGKDPHLDLEKLSDKYGKIMGMYVGSRFLVVLSDFNLVKKSFNKEEFLGRPDSFFRVSSEFKNMAEMNGQEWIDHRRFTINSLKQIFGPRNVYLEEKIMNEVTRFIAKLDSNVNKPRLNIRPVLTPSVNNVILNIVSGSWFDDDEPIMKTFSQFEDLSAMAFANISILYFFPWLAPIYSKFSPAIRRVNEEARIMEQFVRKEVEAHEKDLDEQNPRDYLDHCLIELKNKELKDTLTKDTLIGSALFLLAAGSDTVRNTLEWSLMIMAKYPEIQENVRKEIVENFGTRHSPSWVERSKIPYTEAVIMEITRWRSLTVLNCMRKVTSDTSLNGYDIPKDAYLVNSIWACHMNPEEWKDPTRFNPERFLSNDGSRVIQKENLIPFSFGRRNCPGDKMAKMEVYLFFTASMQKYKFVPPEGGLSFESVVKINAQSSRPFVKVLNRDPEITN